MIIEIDTYENMVEGVAEALDICVEYLREAVLDKYIELYQEYGCSYWDYFHEWIQQFIQDNRGEDITELYICHLARLIEVPEKLEPLQNLMTTENCFSSLLSDNGITARMEGHRILLKYKGQEIDAKRIYSPDRVSNNYCNLAFRLGYFEDKQDFCVNGFAFGAGVENDMNGYFRHLQQGPEILGELDKFLGTSIRNAYKRNSKYYKVYLRVPLTQAIFDGHEELDSEQKNDYFLERCIEYLAAYFDTGEGCSDIPIIRLSDDSSVLIDHAEEVPE